MDRFAEVKRKITAGKNHLDGIYDYLEEMRNELLKALQRIQETITETSPKLEAA